MKRVHVLIEGETEEAAIGQSLQRHLWAYEVHLEPTIIVTKRLASGPNHKGGVASWGQIERDLRLLRKDTGVVAITTLLDYYGLPSDVPGMATRPLGPARGRALHVQAKIDEAMGEPRLRSHLALHEFEAVLYADPEMCGHYLDSPGLTQAMSTAVAECGEPELVNDDPATSPSARIKAACPAYQKTLHGPALVQRIGLAAIRRECPHFDGWVRWLESLGAGRAVSEHA